MSSDPVVVIFSKTNAYSLSTKQELEELGIENLYIKNSISGYECSLDISQLYFLVLLRYKENGKYPRMIKGDVTDMVHVLIESSRYTNKSTLLNNRMLAHCMILSENNVDTAAKLLIAMDKSMKFDNNVYSLLTREILFYLIQKDFIPINNLELLIYMCKSIANRSDLIATRTAITCEFFSAISNSYNGNYNDHFIHASIRFGDCAIFSTTFYFNFHPASIIVN